MSEPDASRRTSERETSTSASAGVLVSSLDDGALAYDPSTETAHLLDRTAAWLLASTLDGPTTIEDLVDEASTATGADRDTVEAGITAAIGALRSLGLLDRDEPYDPPPPLVGSAIDDPTWVSGAAHAVLDHRIAFRGPDATLLADIDRFLGTAVDDRPPTHRFAVEPDGDDGILLRTDTTWRFPSTMGFYAQLPGVLNEYAARSHDQAVLHAGAVRTPAGALLLVPGTIDAGKSTVVAALVQAGCDYLGDESIALRPGTLDLVPYPKPLTLGPVSREVLGLPPSTDPHLAVDALRSDVVRIFGDLGPVTRVIFPEYTGPRPTDPGAVPVATTDELPPVDALRALLANTLNLARGGQQGLDDLCLLAESVPAVRIRHGDSAALAASIVAGALGR